MNPPPVQQTPSNTSDLSPSEKDDLIRRQQTEIAALKRALAKLQEWPNVSGRDIRTPSPSKEESNALAKSARGGPEPQPQKKEPHGEQLWFEQTNRSDGEVPVVNAAETVTESSAPTANSYALYRQHHTPRGSVRPAWHWTMRADRRGILVLRRFHDAIYGGSDAALTVGRAYRDALMLLVPPKTKREVDATPRVTNSSGISGVSRTETNWGAYWSASMRIDGEHLSRAYSIKRYGSKRAKAMAIAKRAEYETRKSDRFATTSADGTELANTHFAHLLQHEMPYSDTTLALTPAAAKERIALLDRWFETLRPSFARVRLSIYQKKAGPMLNVAVLYAKSSARGDPVDIGLKCRTLEQALAAAWEHVQKRLTVLSGEACWHEFVRRYQDAFFAYDGTGSFLALFRHDCPGFGQHFVPPPYLAELLPDFVVPPIPSS